MWSEGVTFVLHLYWAIGVAAVVLRTLSSSFDRVTSYGRLGGSMTGIYSEAWWFWKRGTGFTLFYLTGLVLSSLLLIIGFPVYMIQSTKVRAGHASYFFPLLLFFFHVSRRLLECAFVHKFSGKMTLVGLIGGASFYVGVPATLWFSAYNPWAVYSTWTGLLITLLHLIFNFVIQYAQYYHHKLLAELPKRPRTAPRGGLFGFIVGPHYLFEIVLYAHFAWLGADGNGPFHVCSWPLLFTVVNLGVTAHASRRWLIESEAEGKVPDYHLIPYVW